jgi:hypothetical protein
MLISVTQQTIDTRFQGQLAYKARYAVSLFVLFSTFDH